MSPSEKESAAYVGRGVNRVDGRLKVTGRATYAEEFPVPNPAHAVFVQSTIAAGRLTGLDTAAAERAPGVLRVFTHRNAPRLNEVATYPTGPAGQSKPTLQDEVIHYSGQNIALVLAETFEQATYAAALVEARYQPTKPAHSLDESAATARLSKKEKETDRGDVAAGLRQAAQTVSASYRVPIEHHNPIENYAVLAQWEGDRLTVHAPAQWLLGLQRGLAEALGVPPENVRVVSPFIGGSFGCKAGLWPPATWAAAAARAMGRPVKLVLTREQMYTSLGHRPTSRHAITLGAAADGRLTAISHEALQETSAFDDYTQQVTGTTPVVYACPNVHTAHRLVSLNLGTPFPMRGPGEAENMFVLDSALDELAYALRLDPLEMRLRNHADVDPITGQPWSTKSLKQCYREGARRFGWEKRSLPVRSMRDGHRLVGWGMATAIYPTYLSPAAASARLLADGRAEIRTGGHEIGVGMYTIFTQIAADALGLPLDRVTVLMGDSALPKNPAAAGSRSTASVGPAVRAAALALREALVKLATEDAQSPLFKAKAGAVETVGGRLQRKGQAAVGETYAELLRRNKQNFLDAYQEWVPEGAEPDTKSKVFTGLEAALPPQHAKFSAYTFGAVFVEVKVDELIGRWEVSRVVSAYGAGRILNPKTAASQIRGGTIFGLGMSLMEETLVDPVHGRYLNANIADYHLPVYADVPRIDTFFVEEDDPLINPLGAKGVGEVGNVGVAAAVCNAVFHATGKRIRELPITPEKLMADPALPDLGRPRPGQP